MRTSSLSPQMNEKWNNSHRAQLNTSRDPSKSKETRKIPAEPGRTRERRRKRKRRGSGMGPATLWGDESEKRSPHKGKPLIRELSLDRRRASFSVGENMANRMWQQERERDLHTGYSPLPCPPSLRGTSTTADKCWVLKCGVQRADQGKGLRLAVRKHPERMGLWEELCKWAACGGSLNHQRAECLW